MPQPKKLLKKSSKGVRTLEGISELVNKEKARIDDMKRGTVQIGEIVAAAVMSFLSLPESARSDLAFIAAHYANKKLRPADGAEDSRAVLASLEGEIGARVALELRQKQSKKGLASVSRA